MDDLISRQAAKEAVDTAILHDGIRDALKSCIDDVPAADVRPVVLCGECKFWGRERISCEGLARCNTGETGVRYRNQNDFCSRGEKREEP